MADRYQDQPFAADDHYDHGGNPHAPGRVESDPLAELARLIGQADPFGGAPGASAPAPRPQPLQSRANVRPQQHMRRRRKKTRASPQVRRRGCSVPGRNTAAGCGSARALSRALRRAGAGVPAEPGTSAAPLCRASMPLRNRGNIGRLPYPDAGQEPDPSRYDDALYGRIESGEQDFQRDPAYPGRPLRLSERL